MMKRFLMTLVVGLALGACGGVVTDAEPVMEDTPLEQTGQEVRCGFCGDDFCCAEMETTANCPADCGPSYCGDGVCNTNESSATCAADCGPWTYCGDGSCNGSETSSSCPSDCGPTSSCGDGYCAPGESNLSCPADCPCTMPGKCW